jgi:hypothetical protein
MKRPSRMPSFLRRVTHGSRAIDWPDADPPIIRRLRERRVAHLTLGKTCSSLGENAGAMPESSTE